MNDREWVQVLSLAEIMATLDGEGAVEGLPFMPEMAHYCGGRFQVTAAMSKICGGGQGIRAVRGTSLLLLDELRCDGAGHGGCSRLCTLLWKEAWLKPAGGSTLERTEEPCKIEVNWPFLNVTGSDTYSCQATRLSLATRPLSSARKLKMAIDDVTAGEWSLKAFLKVLARAVVCRFRSIFGRAKGKADKKLTPTVCLALQPGEWVRTKSVKEISTTLDCHNKNRGLDFSIYMVPFCGKSYRVKARMGKFIHERTGKMTELTNTVILEGVSCGGETTFGICRRAECLYWREIWLQRDIKPVHI